MIPFLSAGPILPFLVHSSLGTSLPLLHTHDEPPLLIGVSVGRTVAQ
ncbi:MAG: hypothetical protein OJF47_002052 [Nitrospira sp.]|nr:MAG: hypothetical protein OJF47_002052 [Nitrospira sp.]